ncbi:MAG: PDZ domain-containing protein [Oscillibacter sp.]|nr:PDZ domain-containing protein [Oscillibacter sp.]
MYNDEKNLYHYTYRRDDSGTAGEPTLRQELYRQQTADSWRSVQEMKPVKKNRLGLKITALALVCALFGGAAGGGAVYLAMDRGASGGSPTIQSAGDRTPVLDQGKQPSSTLTVNRVDGLTLMTDAEVYAANVNSVVAISTSGQVSNGWTTRTASGAGSGFILTADGYIATNYHVIEDADRVQVTLYSGETYEAKIINGEEDYDVAVIKIEAENLQPVTFGDSTKLNVGDRVLAIGNPLGTLTFSQTGGMVSSVNRAIDVEGVPFNMIQTDASINPGNSGGPMFNQYGQVVGIVSAKYTSTSSGDNAEGLGFAIPINDVSAIIQDIMTNGYVANRAYLGAQFQSMTESMASQFRYEVTTGVFINYVEPDGPAASAGLRMGDVIIEVDGTEVKTLADFTLAKKKFSAGDTAQLKVYRLDGETTVTVTWGETPAEDLATGSGSGSDNSGNSGQDYFGGGNGYMDPNDFFRYFFGNRYW